MPGLGDSQKANYRQEDMTESYLNKSLAICQRTGEKQMASALDLLATFWEAARLRKMSSSGSKALRDVLSS